MKNPTLFPTPARRPSSTPRSSSSSTGYRAEDFPGCEPFHLPTSEIERYEGRLEFWDGRTETAWKVSEPTTIWHERPSRLLSKMAGQFTLLRGSGIECYGSADLLYRDASGRKRWLMQADEVLYVHPARSRPHGPAIDVDTGPLPDVVLEVDHTTDVRRRKLSIYRESGFPEIWVLVPPQSPVRWPSLTIHVHGGGGNREVPESVAFPGWRAEEIFCALTEDPWSEPTWRAVERVALAMGAREGTRPEDDPLMRSQSLRAEAKGRGEGYTQGRREARAAMVREALRTRGIEVSPSFPEGLALFDESSDEVLMGAALACTSEADLRRRLRAAAR